MTEQTEQSDFPAAWRPEAGSRVKGTLMEVRAIDPTGQGVYPCVTLRLEDGSEVAVHAFHAVLRRELARRAPKVGDEIEILYQGKREGGKNPEGYHAYRVAGGHGQEYDWSQDLPVDERQDVDLGVPIAPAPRVQQPVPAAAVVDDDEDLPF